MNMQSTALKNDASGMSPELEGLIDNACGRIAPVWPLDQMIAVNPWWEMRQQTFAEVSAKISTLAHAHCLMPKSYFAEQWEKEIMPAHLTQAREELGLNDVSIDTLLRHLQSDDDLNHWHNISDMIDSEGDRQHKMAWRDEITHQISQFCAAYFKARKNPADQVEGGLYRQWIMTTRQDPGIEILMDEKGLTRQFGRLPEHYNDLISLALDELKLEGETAADYAHALLLDINGWASWVAYLRWQDRLDGKDNHLMRELLAIRMAWDLVLWRHQSATSQRLAFVWKYQLTALPKLLKEHIAAQELSWVWQRAHEIAYQNRLHRALRAPLPEASSELLLQAAFCIDVRSEIMRRSLETQHPGIRTMGFAGFFGLPLEYQPSGTGLSRPQLPGLLRSAIKVTDKPYSQDALEQRQAQLNRRARWANWGNAAPATFSMVESSGLMYAFKLLKNSMFPSHHHHPVNDLPGSCTFEMTRNNQPLSTEEKADLAAGILGAMGLTSEFAPQVLLVGHGSQTTNNPHAAGLDCGACGGQTGEVNVKVLAQLLNDPEVRRGLEERSIRIPPQTRFIAALHNTTTDEIICYDMATDEQLQRWLDNAGDLTRHARAERMGLAELGTAELKAAMKKRANDWSQVRPEWALANNAAFIVAPRNRTAGLNLEGRTFLHDYQWQQDPGFKVLELIMTAPMVVTNWINLQYYASVADNLKYGSGNKVLHNVVGGNIGVFEGNGGDLRIGLAMQSIHDGEQWMHTPLRLSVYIAAPRDAIADITAQHDVVRQLIDNDWLFLFRLDDDGKTIERFYHNQWTAMS